MTEKNALENLVDELQRCGVNYPNVRSSAIVQVPDELRARIVAALQAGAQLVCNGDVKACNSDVPCSFGALWRIERLKSQLADADATVFKLTAQLLEARKALKIAHEYVATDIDDGVPNQTKACRLIKRINAALNPKD